MTASNNSQILLLLLTFSLALGCATSRERHLLEASEALEQCDIRRAHAEFEGAYDEDCSDPDSSLGFALTGLALLPEAAPVEAALSDVGFTGPVDMQALMFGEQGALARLARGDSCDSVRTHLEASLPYAPITSDVSPASLVRSGMTAQDLMTRLSELEPRLGKLAGALETAADGLAGPVTVEGGCGLGTVVLQQPELYAAAAAMELLRALIIAAEGYDWAMPADLLLTGANEDITALADSLNAHFLRLTDAERVEAARPRLASALTLASRAVTSARGITGPVENGLFDWSQMDRTLLDDAGALTVAASAALDAPTAIPFMTPELRVDLGGLFTNPIDASGSTAPLFIVYESEFDDYQSLEMDEEGMEALLRERFSPSPFDGDFEWSAEPRWSDMDVDSVVDPSTRFEGIFQCEGDSVGEVPTRVGAP